MPTHQPPLPSLLPGAPLPPHTSGGMSPSTRAAAAAALRRQHKMTLERKVSDNAVSDTPLSTCTAGPGPNSDEYFGPLAGFTATASGGAATPSLTAITANIATTSDRRGLPGTPGRGLGVAGRQVMPPRLQPITALGGGEEKGRRRESVAGGEAGKKKGVWEHGRGRGEVSLDGEEAEVERKKQQETLEKLKEMKKAGEF